MPLLCEFSTTREPARAGVGPTRLARLLCPYRGEIRPIDVNVGTLYVSELVDVHSGEATTLRAPKGTRKNAQTAWLEVTVTDEGVRFETDPLGTFPLWCFEDAERLVITSEVKSLGALAAATPGVTAFRADAFEEPRRAPDFSPYARVRRVTPGATLRVTRDLACIEERRRPLVYRPDAMLPPGEREEHLAAALLASARAIGAAEGPWGAFVSGGIDSSVATSLLHRIHPELQTFTLGTALGDEYAEAEKLASFLGTKHTRVFASEPDALQHFERAVFSSETTDGLTAETLAQLGILAQAAAPGVKRVVTGYGADLLFGSMLRHELYMKVTGVDDLQSLIERTMWTGEFCPFFAWSLGIEVHHLFWDPDVMNTAFRIPPDASFDGTHEKVVLRGLAERSGWLRHEHAWHTKRALTDGTQFNRTLSSALGLAGAHAYGEKNARAIARLGRTHEEASHP